MRKLSALILDQREENTLAEKQKKIDQLGNYASQVTAAKNMWGSKGKFAAIRKALAKRCGVMQRCQYCEDSAADEIEHIWPKNFYPEKTFVATNYLYCCGACNGTHKRDQWAVFSANGNLTKLVRNKNEAVMPPWVGPPVFLDPHLDDPFEFMTLDIDTGMFVALGAATDANYQRAEYTIEVLGLNKRDFLCKARRNAYHGYLRDAREFVQAKQVGPTHMDFVQAQLKEGGHPSVWAEIKRLAKQGVKHQEIFAAAPELWSI